ncbi:MAG: FG-GAP-like repeat-containing protein, partial [Planctomycetota bacterium]
MSSQHLPKHRNKPLRAETLESRVVLSANNTNAVFGDYDLSGTADDGDYAVWRDSFGSTELLAADGNLDGVVNSIDYTIWRDNFGRVLTEDFDFGDAPASYGTSLADDGARHAAVGPTLGATRDGDFDGVPSDLADADGADEDGILFVDPIQVGALGVTAFVDVFGTQGQATKLDAWIDFNGDGSFGGIGEQIFSSLELAGGPDGRRLLRFDVPSYAVAGEQIARFRLSTEGDLGPTGAAADGEVEDYVVTIVGPTASDGVFADQPAISDSPTGASSVSAADIDGDRDMDVVSSRGNTLVWHRNLGGGVVFTEQIIDDTFDANLSASIAADLDGDGDMDVISATNFQNGVTDRGVFWHENDGSGNFTRRGVSDAGAVNRVESLFVSDVDGDGDQDILAITNSTNGNNVSVLVNNGSQSFSRQTVGSASFGRSVFAADVDSDGDIDVLSASRNDDKVAWFENQGGLSFQEHVLTTSANGAASVFAVDIDGDGDTDVISASNQDSTVAWFENDGNQNFTERVISTNDRGTFAVFAADYDGDGDIDVLSSATANQELVLHVNDGNQNFAKRVVATGLASARRITTADIDGDGDLDAITASATAGSTVSWFENRLLEGQPEEVFDNGAGGVNTPGQVFADSPGDRLSADDVVLAETTLVTSIAWNGRYQDPINNNAPVEVDDFTIAIYADDGNSPSSRLLAEFNVGNAANRTPTDRNFIFSYEAEINFLMEEGVRYWVSLRNNTPDDFASFQWLVDPDLTNNVHFSADGGATWLFQGQQADFRLSGVIVDPPESAGTATVE